MTFIELYGTELDRELGTADRTARFTTARRKAAINAAQLEFAKRTHCLTRQALITLADGTQEYDLEAANHHDSGSALTITVDAAAGTFTRAAGSFVTDGFVAGETIVTSGFTNAGNNATKIISTVSALVITVTSVTGLVNETGNGNERVVAPMSDFGGIVAQGVSLKITDSNDNVRYIEGDALVETSVERLNVEEAGWRAASAGTPRKLYLRRHNGTLNLGLHPAPDFASGDAWHALVPYWAIPADMSADADEPFTVLSDAVRSLRPYHRALAHYAAHDLEKLRKDVERIAMQLQLFEGYVAEYEQAQKPLRGTRVRMARNYRRGGPWRRIDRAGLGQHGGAFDGGFD